MKRILKMGDIPKKCWISATPNLEAELYDQSLIDSGWYIYICIYFTYHIMTFDCTCLLANRETNALSESVCHYFSSLVQQPKLCLNELRTTRSCQATKCRMPSQSEKLKGQKTLADIAHFESCARQPFQTCHGSGAAFFFSLSKMMAVKPSHVGEVKLDKGYTSSF